MDGLAHDPDFTVLLGQSRAPAPLAEASLETLPAANVETLSEWLTREPELRERDLRQAIEAVVAGIDRLVAGQLNTILHAPEFQALEGSWRGLHMLVRASDRELGVKVRVFNISKRDLGRTLRKFRGQAWDQSPIFRRIYDDEFG